MSWPELEWPLTGELVYNRCDDVQYRYVAAWAGGWMAMVSVGEWHEQRTVRLNYGHGIAGGRPLKVSQINGATLEDNVAASLTATFSVFACPSGERATHSAAWRGLGLG